jgi:hypothetical protein
MTDYKNEDALVLFSGGQDSGQNKLLETLKRCAFPTDNGIRWK